MKYRNFFFEKYFLAKKKISVISTISKKKKIIELLKKWCQKKIMASHRGKMKNNHAIKSVEF